MGLSLNRTDGFSVPFLSFGRKVHSRTISLSQTFTSRGSDGAVPDWLLWARRPGTASPNTTTFDDVEGGRVIPISETQQISGDMRAGVSLIQEADIVGMNPARAGKESDGGHAKSESEECPRTVSPDGVERERREAINEGTFVGPEFGEASMLASPKQARIVKRPPPLTDVVRYYRSFFLRIQSKAHLRGGNHRTTKGMLSKAMRPSPRCPRLRGLSVSLPLNNIRSAPLSRAPGSKCVNSHLEPPAACCNSPKPNLCTFSFWIITPHHHSPLNPQYFGLRTTITRQ